MSYPRTETDQYDQAFNFDQLISKQTADSSWGNFASSLESGGFSRPRNGNKNDKAHPPIHPTAHAPSLSGSEKRVYDFVTRRFLASCSKDAKGKNTTAIAEMAGESFKATGSILLEKNYLDVYVYDKWSNSVMPNFQEGETFQPSVCELRDGKTTPPTLLTEADLVTLMDKNGIGTDATIAEHIHKIIDREYVMEHKQGNTKYLVPSTLGVALVEGYNKMNFEKSFAKPELRRENEEKMNMIGEGIAQKNDVLLESINQYRDIYKRSAHQFATLVSSVKHYLQNADAFDDTVVAENGQNAEDDEDGYGGFNNNGDDNSDSDMDDPSPPPARGREQPRGSTNKRTTAGSRGNTRNGAQSDYTMTEVREPPSNNNHRTNTSQPKEGEVRCKCNLSAKRYVTSQGANKGRAFWKCPNISNSAQCNFWSWEDALELPRQSAAAEVVDDSEEDLLGDDLVIADDDGEIPYCDLCSKNGHWPSACPRPSMRPAPKPSTTSTARKSTSSSAGGSNTRKGDTCYKCNRKGHWASNCPNEGKAPAKRKTSTKKSSQKKQRRT